MEKYTEEWREILYALNDLKTGDYISQAEYDVYKEAIKAKLPVLCGQPIKETDYSSYHNCLSQDEIYNMMEKWFENETLLSEVEKEIKKLKRIDLYHLLQEHNWDDGFAIPALILKHPDCDLALAMDIFVLAGGPYFLQDYIIDGKQVEEYEKEDWQFCLKLFNDMGTGKYKEDDTPQELDVGLQILLLKKGIVNKLTKDFEFLLDCEPLKSQNIDRSLNIQGQPIPTIKSTQPQALKDTSTNSSFKELEDLISEEEQRIKPKEINLQEEIKNYDFVMRIDGCYRITGIGVIIEGYVLKGQIGTGENAYYIDNLGKKQIQIDKIEVFKRHPDGKAYEGEFITITQNQLDRTEISKDGYIVGNSRAEKNPSIINSIRELEALNAKSKQEHAEKKKKRFLEEIKKYDFVMSLDDCGPIDGGIMFRGYVLKGQIGPDEDVYYINDMWHKKQIHIDILEVFENDRESDGKAYKDEFVIIVDQNMVDYTDMGFGEGYYIVGNHKS